MDQLERGRALNKKFTEHIRVPLKGNPELTEKWVQTLLNEKPSLLGLGELDVLHTEKIQPHAGRLDMLLLNPESTTRYEVELQLGPTDESHIIRTLEYWDIERKRFPQYDHVAVIVAERITARFFNVISLFNGYIPIIAVEMRAIEIGDFLTLVFTTILEPVQLAFEELEVSEPVDRKYWETKASKAMLEVTDDLLKLVRDVAPEMSLNYNKHYIGLARDGVASNFVTFRPRRQRVLAEYRIPLSEEITAYLEGEGMDMVAYDSQWGRYRLRVDRKDLENRKDVLGKLTAQAHENLMS